MGKVERAFRLPLCETSAGNLERMRETLAGISLL
jgi:hypothetical protein